MDKRYPDERRGIYKRDDDKHSRHGRHRTRSRSSSSSSSSGSDSRGRSRSRSSSSDRDEYRHRERSNKGESSSSRDLSAKHNNDHDDKFRSRESNEPACPPPPIISKSKVSVAFAKPAKPVQMKLAVNKPVETVKKLAVASAFSNNSDDDDDDDEEIPHNMKYSRNIGRDTPTSSGPNSFGKTKQGFCDSKKIFEKTLREYKD